MGTITKGMLEKLEQSLRYEERSKSTMEKYLRDVAQFRDWLEDRPLCREEVSGWKDALLEKGMCAGTVNCKLSALNALFRLIGREDCKARFLKVQREVFRDEDRNLSREEYFALVRTARRLGKERLALIMETICACGIRVSELPYITVEAVRRGKAVIRLKGKLRTIMLPGKLCRKLETYLRENGISHGAVFRTRNGTPISRRQIWGEMKSVCRQAGVEPSKVYPHNLRHLFAVEHYRENHDIVKLADTLGHSSIETTRIYLISTGEEHQRLLEHMRLVS